MKFIREHWIFIVLLLIGLTARLVFMSDQGFSNDELSAWYRTRHNSWNDFWFYGVKHGDMHPAFYQVLLWVWVRLFGDSEFSIRLTSLLFYVFNSYLIYKIACKHFTQISGLLLTGLYAGLTFTIINTVFARPYNSGVFFLLLSFYALLELRNEKSFSWKLVLLLAVGLWGAMISHYFAFLVAIILGGCALFYVGKKKIKYVLLSGILAVLFFLPHLSITLHQVGRGGLQWLATPKLDWPIEFIHLFFNKSWLVFGILCLLFIALIVVNGFNRISKEIFFSLSIFIVTFVSAFILSHVFTPILREIVMLFTLPFLFIALFTLVNIKPNQKLILIGLITFLPLIDSFLRNRILEPVHFGVFKEIGEGINHANELYSKDSITFATNSNNVGYINYYVENDLTETIIDWDLTEAFFQLDHKVKSAKTPYFAYSYINKFHSPMFLEIIRRKYPHLEYSVIAGESMFFLFKKSENRALPEAFFTSTLSDTTIHENEFFGDVKMTVKDLPTSSNRNAYYLISGEGVYSKDHPLICVATLNRNGKPLMNGEYPLLYAAYDQTRLAQNSTGKNEFYLAFQLPEMLLPSDELIVYMWNPEKAGVKVESLNFYLIDDLDAVTN